MTIPYRALASSFRFLLQPGVQAQSAPFNRTLGSRLAALRMNSTTTAGAAKDLSGQGVVAKRFDNIVKSVQDQREYRGLELTNGLRILLVSDPDTDKSAAAMDVNVGHMMDPWNLPGTAHFCEHMLFLGTDKYPSENEYSKYLAANAGSSNAFTATDHTNYHFDVKPDSLTGALDRFAQFFLTPQFTESATEREVEAVDSEHNNNLNSDGWRFQELDRMISIKGHDYGKFGTGNKKTLVEDARKQGIEPREALLKFHKDFYSSNLMCLVVVGKEPLDHLEKDVLAVGFGDIVDKKVERRFWPSNLDKEHTCKIIEIAPIKDIRTMQILFPFPDLVDEHNSNPDGIINQLLGHEGKNSLFAFLRQRGWALSLCTGCQKVANGFGKFTINIELTPEGLEHSDEVLKALFNYIGLIKREGVQKWIHEELAELAEMKFRFKDKESPCAYAQHIATRLHRVGFEEILTYDHLITEYNPERTRELIDLLDPSNANIRIVGKKFEGRPENAIEPIYGTEYQLYPIPDELLKAFYQAMNEPNPVFALPAPNEYIATNFDLVPRDPKDDDKWLRVWFKQDQEYLLPKKLIKVSLQTPLVLNDVNSTIAGSLFLMCVQDALSEDSYNPELAGLGANLDLDYTGMEFRVRGFSEKQNQYLLDVSKKILNFKTDEARFLIMKDQLLRSLENFRHSQPYILSQHYSQLMVSQRYYPKEELKVAAEAVTVADVDNFLSKVLEAFFMEIFVHGNATEQNALDFAHEVLKVTQRPHSRPITPAEHVHRREHVVPYGERSYHHFQETHPASNCDIFFQFGPQGSRQDVIVDLFHQCINEQAFNVLRTNESLGYIVHTGSRRSCGTLGFTYLVQGPRKPDFVEERMEEFLKTCRQTIAEMSAEEFYNNVEALASKRLEKPKTLNARCNRFWNEISLRRFHFSRAEDEVTVLRTVTKEELLDFFDRKLAKDAPERRKIVVYVHSNEDTEETRRELLEKDKDRIIPCCVSFKGSLDLWPLPEPHGNYPPAGVEIPNVPKL